MRTWLRRSVALLGLIGSPFLAAQESASPPPDDLARFLAGLPPQAESAFAPLSASPAVARYAWEIERDWRDMERWRLAEMGAWARAQIQPRIARPRTLFYFFGGPDFVSVATLFPDSGTYVLCGLEPVGRIPDPRGLAPEMLRESLGNLAYSLRSLVNKGFFETKEMREDFAREGINGVWPVLYLSAARTGHSVVRARPITLSADGAVVPATDGSADGVEIALKRPEAGREVTLYYFKTDLSDSGIRREGRFLKFCEALPDGGSYLKAASYLMHGPGFDRAREFLLRRSRFVLQDDSGIPLRFFSAGGWSISPFGSYRGPVEIFKQYEQAEMHALYAESAKVQPLPFGSGYRRTNEEANLIFAARETAAKAGSRAP